MSNDNVQTVKGTVSAISQHGFKIESDDAWYNPSTEQSKREILNEIDGGDVVEMKVYQKNNGHYTILEFGGVVETNESQSISKDRRIARQNSMRHATKLCEIVQSAIGFEYEEDLRETFLKYSEMCEEFVFRGDDDEEKEYA